MTDIAVKIMVELLTVLALATKRNEQTFHGVRLLARSCRDLKGL
jgi:hypothetical protein